MKPTSYPRVPDQPDAVQYGVEQLYLFRQYDRESYQAAFGRQAPPFDPARRVKTWFDSSVDAWDGDAPVVYKIIGVDGAGAPAIRSVVLTASEAGTVNLPGAVQYPAREVAPTAATRGGVPLNPEYLSLAQEARELQAAIRAGVLVDEGESYIFGVVYPPAEARRMWALVVDGVSHNVGALLADRHRQGYNSPGAWKLESGRIEWVPAAPVPSNPGDGRPPREVPVRELLPNEVLGSGRFAPVVIRTDKRSQVQEQSGWFTTQDRETLRQCRELLEKIVQA